MKILTLDEYVEKIHTKESMIKEDRETCVQLESFTKALYDRVSEGGKVKILTDYDCDGITSAYIMEQAMHALRKDIETEVVCNDRRTSYGVPKNQSKEENAIYIVLDTGSNELDYLDKTFGLDNVFLADHHIVEQESDRNLIISSDNLLNPHVLHADDEENAQYCAAGLAYRIYQILSENVGEFEHNEKRDNTVSIMAAIGTIGDVVNLMDLNSLNRKIVQDGMERINKATEDNLYYPIGYALRKNDISNIETNAKQIAFGIVSFINAASRMSSYMGQNGAQKMYNALSGDERSPDTYFELDDLLEINKIKKDLCKELQDSNYYNFISGEKETDKTCLVYPLNMNLKNEITDGEQAVRQIQPMAGIIAGRIAEATGKAAICMVYHRDGDYWSGSGRNPDYYKSLQQFIRDISKTEEMKDVILQFGGHEDAIGISRMEKFDSIFKLSEAVNKHKDLLQRKENYENVYIKMDLDRVNTSDTYRKIMSIQPLGEGNTIPPIIVTGKLEEETKKSLIGKNPHWAKRTITVPGTKTSIDVKDWNYDHSNYLTNDKKETTYVAEMDINIWNKRVSIELTRKHDVDYFRNYTIPFAKNNFQTKNIKNTKNQEEYSK